MLKLLGSSANSAEVLIAQICTEYQVLPLFAVIVRPIKLLDKLLFFLSND
jgi:hypothetical protein